MMGLDMKHSAPGSIEKTPNTEHTAMMRDFTPESDGRVGECNQRQPVTVVKATHLTSDSKGKSPSDAIAH